ncbi:MAG: 50S ribosomal protein L9 [Rickettsiales bacterium]|nr:50S ribosomal protein L9 [Rickettsiales bacterium]
MKVILVEQVDKLGTVGDTVNVKSGYARNYLIPNSLALRATESNVKYYESQKDELIKKHNEKKAEAKKVFDQINEAAVNVIRMSSDEGKLYGSVTTKDIADALTNKYNTEFKKSSIIMGNAIRETGIFPVKVRVHPEYMAVITLCIGQNDAAIKKMIQAEKAKIEAENAVSEASSSSNDSDLEDVVETPDAVNESVEDSKE